MRIARRTCIATALAATLAGGATRASAGEPSARLTVKESATWDLDPQGDRRTLVASADLSRFAYVARRPEGSVVVVDGKAGKPYGSVGPIVFSPDGRRYGHLAIEKDLSWRVVLDGVEGPAYADKFETTLRFGPNGKRAAYVATRTKDGKASMFVVVEGVEGKAYDGVVFGSLAFGPGAGRLVYASQTASSPAPRTTFVVDGVEGKAYVRLGDFTFSPDGARWGFVAVGDAGVVVVVDGVEGRPLPSAGPPTFSADGKHWAHAARRRDGTWTVVVDGAEKQGISHELIGGKSVRLGPDGARLVYAARKGNAWRVIVDGVEGKEYPNVGGDHLLLSPDGKRVAYWASTGPRTFWVVDGVAGPEFDQVGYDDVRKVVDFQFSTDGAHTAYSGDRNARYIAVQDGVEGPAWEGMARGSPAISPDGTYAVSQVKRRGRWVVAVADAESPSDYETLVLNCPPVFTGPRTFSSLVLNGTTLVRLDVEFAR